MKFEKYLREHQPLVYRTFENAMSYGRLSHAYLLSGEAGTPLLETATFLAKSLLCEHPSPLADEECRYCRRIENRTYGGFLILGEKGETIKKEQIETMVSSFSLTPLEEGKRNIYIINGVENMTPEALNSLLKFLEEPPSFVTAFLLTNNVAKVLPTIVSRCENLRLLLAPRNEVADEAEALGVAREDAELLAYFYNNAAAIPEVSGSEDYLEAKDLLTRFLRAVPLGADALYLAVDKDILPKLDEKRKARFFLDLLSLAFKDALSARENGPILLSKYAKLIEPLERLENLEKCLLEIMKDRAILDLNIPTGTLLDHLVYSLSKESLL